MMGELQLAPAAQQWVNVTLIWVGFGTLAGLLARCLMPGREPAGVVGTLLTGILGSVVGPMLLCHTLDLHEFNPISPLGFLAAVGGALAALVGYRLVTATVRIDDEEGGELPRSGRSR
jgi:uncharacterized membrane protein YeaQ/YmgE (transglycosylase-associated protein family)